jgi:hypothetical protein
MYNEMETLQKDFSQYSKLRKVKDIPRLPLEGITDLTYRCNNDCRQYWLRIPADSPKQQEELGFDEIRRIVDEVEQESKWLVESVEEGRSD